ncbi:MAG: hypothetical protein AAGC84_15685, partial [Pseudomonas sp.]
MTEDLRALGQKARVHIAGHWLLFMLAVLVFALILYAGKSSLIAAKTALERHFQASREQRLQSADYAWRLALKQLQQRPAQFTGLYLWLRRSTGERTLENISELAPHASTKALLASFSACYASEQDAQQAASNMLQVLPGIRHAVSERKKVSRV